MNCHSKRLQAALLMAAMLAPAAITQGMTLWLAKGFVKKYKDKVTITTSLKVDKHHQSPNGIDSDGDIHMAGRDSVVLLPMVAEIINGRNEKDTMQFLLQTSAGQQVDVTGVWRLWFEHTGAQNTSQTQGLVVEIPDDTDPKHLFEIHPITKFGSFNCLDSFLPIVDNQAHPTQEFRGTPATTAFPSYDSHKITISRSNTAIMLDTKKAVYNYTDFFIKLAGKPKDVGDGYMVFANISATKNFSEPLLVEGTRRMIFAKDSAPANAVKNLVKGDKLHVLGVPRVNLNEIFAEASNLAVGEVLPDQKLPYEMIIVAVIK
ncbi:MAG: hypothetical protein M3R67_14355 [Acidobacteriota bacterium]|nr:hypothetical protein [Acidobacteriota bacterium]